MNVLTSELCGARCGQAGGPGLTVHRSHGHDWGRQFSLIHYHGQSHASLSLTKVTLSHSKSSQFGPFKVIRSFVRITEVSTI